MRTTSNIYHTLMQLQAKNDFKESLNALMEKYNIKDNIFTYRNGICEVCKGYFVPSHTFESLEDAMNNITNENGIRIMNNKEFQLGMVYKFLHECEGAEQFFDIETSNIIC